MSIRLYDKAITEKIQHWIKDNRLRVLSPEDTNRLFQISADIENDRGITLPLIAISRDTNITIGHTQRRPLSFDGKLIESDGKHSLQINTIPISLNYQLDIYTERYDEGDEYLRNFLFNLINFPTFYVDIPYNNQHFKHIATIKIENQVEDTSNISQRLFPGQFTRWTIRFTVDDAYLFSIPFVDNVHINDVVLDVKMDEDKEIEPVYQLDKQEPPKV